MLNFSRRLRIAALIITGIVTTFSVAVGTAGSASAAIGDACSATGPTGGIVSGHIQQVGAFQICVADGTVIPPTPILSGNCIGAGAHAADCAAAAADLQRASEQLRRYRDQLEDLKTDVFTRVMQTGYASLHDLAEEARDLKRSANNTEEFLKYKVDAVKSAGGSITKLDPLNFTTPGYSGTSSSVTLGGNYDFRRALDLSVNQGLVAGLVVTYDNTRLTGTGTTNSDSWSFAGAAAYRLDRSYIIGSALGSDGRSSIDSAAFTGKYGTNGYMVDIAGGHVFSLWQRPTPSRPMYAKARPMEVYGLAAVDLDLRGRLGYASLRTGAFTDLTGFNWGVNDIHTGVVGASATLTAHYLTPYGIMRPFLTGAIDQYTGYSNSIAIPAQLGAGADALIFHDARTWGRVEGGLALDTRMGPRLAASAYYKFSSQIDVYGGSVSIKIPF